MPCSGLLGMHMPGVTLPAQGPNLYRPFCAIFLRQSQQTSLAMLEAAAVLSWGLPLPGGVFTAEACLAAAAWSALTDQSVSRHPRTMGW